MFNEEQLNTIKEAAKKSKNQGELAVYKFLHFQYFLEEDQKFTESQWNIIKYCAEECKRQHSGEMSVYDMVKAWSWAMMVKDMTEHMVDLDFIATLGSIVEPDDNKNGFRTIPIGVNDPNLGWIEKAPHHRIEFLLSTLLSSYYEGLLDPKHSFAVTSEDQFYYEYENIHPFRDGNGRSGKIIYNYLNGTLDDPQMPPNFWGGSNP